jgi:hypothetical protein
MKKQKSSKSSKYELPKEIEEVIRAYDLKHVYANFHTGGKYNFIRYVNLMDRCDLPEPSVFVMADEGYNYNCRLFNKGEKVQMMNYPEACSYLHRMKLWRVMPYTKVAFETCEGSNVSACNLRGFKCNYCPEKSLGSAGSYLLDEVTLVSFKEFVCWFATVWCLDIELYLALAGRKFKSIWEGSKEYVVTEYTTFSIGFGLTFSQTDELTRIIPEPVRPLIACFGLGPVLKAVLNPFVSRATNADYNLAVEVTEYDECSTIRRLTTKDVSIFAGAPCTYVVSQLIRMMMLDQKKIYRFSVVSPFELPTLVYYLFKSRPSGDSIYIKDECVEVKGLDADKIESNRKFTLLIEDERPEGRMPWWGISQSILNEMAMKVFPHVRLKSKYSVCEQFDYLDLHRKMVQKGLLDKDKIDSMKSRFKWFNLRFVATVNPKNVWYLRDFNWKTSCYSMGWLDSDLDKFLIKGTCGVINVDTKTACFKIVSFSDVGSLDETVAALDVREEKGKIRVLWSKRDLRIVFVKCMVPDFDLW